MVMAKNSKMNDRMKQELLKEDDIKAHVNVNVGLKRHLKLRAYLINHRKGMEMREWLMKIIDDLPD